jgi:DNA-directed RNA polymerase subunit RPC12/RpoP
MSNVLQLRKEELSPTLEGTAYCMSCKHEFESISDVGTEFLKCPKCSLVKAVFKWPVQKDILHWRCNCGNMMFFASEHGVYCPNCAEWQVFGDNI